MKRLISIIKCKYREHCELMYWHYADRSKDVPKYMYYWVVFLWKSLISGLTLWYQRNIGYGLCNAFGHKWTGESGGDAESGPITYTWCSRCPEAGETQWGM